MPPIGEPLCGLLLGWREKHPEVVLTVAEMNEWEIQTAIQERRVDVALMTSHTLWPNAVTAPLYRERVVAAIPREHPLSNVRGARLGELAEGDLPRSGLGQQSVRARVLRIVHGQRRQIPLPRREQAVRVRAGWSRIRNHARHARAKSEVVFPGVVYRPIRRGECLGARRACLVSRGRRPCRWPVRRLHARRGTLTPSVLIWISQGALFSSRLSAAISRRRDRSP